jgi:hypothetical protein
MTVDQLAARFDAIANQFDDSDWSEVMRSAKVQLKPRGSRRQTHRRLRQNPLALAVASLIAVSAIATVTALALNRGASRSAPTEYPTHNSAAAAPSVVKGGPTVRRHTAIRVGSLVAFTYRQNAVSSPGLPASVAEVVANLDADISTAQEPFTGRPSVYLFRRASSDLCLVIVVTHASGSCYHTLAAADGTITNPSLSIVDERMFITGLAANDVQSIRATLETTPTTPATTRPASIENNVFLADLPYDGGAVGTVTLTVVATSGSESSFTLPGVPAPVP